MILFIIGALVLSAAITQPDIKNSTPQTTKDFVERSHQDRIK